MGLTNWAGSRESVLLKKSTRRRTQSETGNSKKIAIIRITFIKTKDNSISSIPFFNIQNLTLY